MPFSPRTRFSWRLRTRSLPLGRRTLLMGILNVTPDSFTDGNRYMSVPAALEHGLRMLDEGADLLDLGGESTRPGSTPVTTAEEQERLLPVMAAILKARPYALLSVDTYHADTARAALEAGAEVINDVSGLLWDPAMAALLAEFKPGAVLMHTRGAPRAWSELPALPHADIMPLVKSGLTHSLELARAAGVEHDRIVIDPGFGFGKLGDANFVLQAHLYELSRFRLPLLAGTSRKRFLTAHLAGPGETERDQATIASNTAAILGGAHLLRVHDVAAAKVASSVADSILNHAQD